MASWIDQGNVRIIADLGRTLAQSNSMKWEPPQGLASSLPAWSWSFPLLQLILQDQCPQSGWWFQSPLYSWLAHPVYLKDCSDHSLLLLASPCTTERSSEWSQLDRKLGRTHQLIPDDSLIPCDPLFLGELLQCCYKTWASLIIHKPFAFWLWFPISHSVLMTCFVVYY